MPISARADKCYVDSDCPAGYECTQSGACRPAIVGEILCIAVPLYIIHQSQVAAGGAQKAGPGAGFAVKF